MKKLSRFSKIAFFILTSASYIMMQSAKAQSEERNVKNFDKIGFSIAGDMYIKQGSDYSLRLEGDRSQLDKIVTKVEGNSLEIKTRNKMNISGKVIVYVTVPDLEALSIAGSGDVWVEDEFRVERLTLAIGGSGDVRFKDLQVKSAYLSVAGSGDIKINGKCEESTDISVAGSGDINVGDFECKKVNVSIAGSGDVRAFATEKLTTNIVGSGSVIYKGNPLVHANSIGSGTTKAM